LKLHRLLLKISVLSAAVVSALIAKPARAATIVVNNQSQFDAAIAVATQPGHADTIDARTAGTIDASSSLTVPGAATSINLQFDNLGIGASTGDGTVTLGAGTSVSFGQPGSPAALNMGLGHTGTLNIDGAALTFNITNAGTQFNVGLDGGNGIVNMTGGSVTVNDSNAVPGIFGSISIGYPFGTTAANATFNQSGGTVSVSAGALNVGVANGIGTYNLTNTAVLQDQGGTIYIGASTGGVGVVNITGSVTIDLESIGSAGQLYVGDDLGIGTITQNGASSTVILNVANIAQFGSNASSGPSLGGTGTYNLLAGTLKIGNGGIGIGGAAFGMDVGGFGFLNQSGGVLIATAPVIIGNSGTGTYNMSDGTANFGAGLRVATNTGSVGVVNQTGGVLTISGGSLSMGAAGAAIYNLNGGMLQIGGTNPITTGAGTYQFNLGGGTIQVLGSNLISNINFDLGGGSVSTIDTNGLAATFSGALSGGGGLAKAGVGTLVLSGANSYAGGTFLNAGVINVTADNNLGAASGALTFNGGALQLGAAFNTARDVVLNSGTIDTNGFNTTFSGAFSGAGGLTKQGAGILTLSGASAYAGPTSVDAGTLQAGAANAFAPTSAFTIASGSTLDLNSFNQTIGSLAGAGALTLGSATLTTGGDGTSTTFSGGISGRGGLTKVGTGALTLSGVNTYTGDTAISGGNLFVASTGSIANSLTVVDNGGTLAGDGMVGAVTVRGGGTLAPGPVGAPGTMTIAGNLAFQSGAFYLVQVALTSANVAGSATLTGSVRAVLAPGSYTARRYDILHAAGGLGGTTFSDVTTNAPGFAGSLSYTATDVFLTLNATLGAGTTLSQNQQNVANAINTFFNNGGTLPADFFPIFGLSGGNLANTLSRLDGEAATGAERAGLQLTNEFLTLMLDPFVNGRANVGGGGGPAMGFGPETKTNLPPDVALAYASILGKAQPKPAFDQRWTAWGAAFGGSNIAGGNPVAGSNNVTVSTYGFASGVDYHLSTNTMVGFALAGAGTNWGLADAFGAGRSDALQAGVYGISWFGPAYVAGALALTNHWFTTNRSALGDQLTASFDGQSYGARLEGGYRYDVVPTLGLTPYGAVQFQNFHTPTYSEGDASGGGFGLTYNAMNATDVRTELGTRFHSPMQLYGRPLVLYGRLAWAHDFASNPSLSAAFETLPGASFTVNGAPMPHDSALTTVGAQLFLSANWSLLAKFDGEFAQGSQTYAGSSTLRYTW
jgi:autotransporter-associated beta strand protein